MKIFNITNSIYNPFNISKKISFNGKSSNEIKNKNSFRDEELFYDDTDIKFYYGPEKYGLDDIPVREALWKNFADDNAKLYYYGIDTNIFPEEIHFIYNVRHPWITKKDIEELEKEQEYKYSTANVIRQITKTDPKTIKDIFKSSTLLTNGEMKINHDLCDLAIRLYKNSKQWTQTERDILKEVKIKFFQSYYTGYSEKKYNVVLGGLLCDKSNEDILERLRSKYPNSMDLSSVFTEEEIKNLFL